MKELDLYKPLKQFLESQGYEVKGEINGCDVVAIRNTEEPVIIELKLCFNLEVVIQAVDRLRVSSKVYIGIPHSCKVLKRRRRSIIQLLRMLSLGLLIIDLHRHKHSVEVLIDPGEYRPKKSKFRRERLLGEFVKRVGDPNPGGMQTRRGLLTVYRQRTLDIAQFLQKTGPVKASKVASEIQEPKAREIMYRNVYGWFERVSPGKYDLSPLGRLEVPRWLDR